MITLRNSYSDVFVKWNIFFVDYSHIIKRHGDDFLLSESWRKSLGSLQPWDWSSWCLFWLVIVMGCYLIVRGISWSHQQTLRWEEGDKSLSFAWSVSQSFSCVKTVIFILQISRVVWGSNEIILSVKKWLRRSFGGKLSWTRSFALYSTPHSHSPCVLGQVTKHVWASVLYFLKKEGGSHCYILGLLR